MITENNLRKKENKSIMNKAEFIENHSLAILKQLGNNNENFKEIFLQFLISDNDDFSLSEITDKENIKDYFLSLEVIFKMCFLLEDSDFTKEQKENFRNKLRLYTKRFQVEETTDLRKANIFIQFNHKEYEEKRKKLLKRR